MPVTRIHSIVLAVLTVLAYTGVYGQTRLAVAEYYRYKDNRGIICITNNVNAVPPKYRSGMKVIQEDKPGRLEKGIQSETLQGRPSAPSEPAGAGQDRHAAAPAQTDSRIGQVMARFPLFKLLIIIAGIVAASAGIMKLTSLISSPQLARVINIAFFLGVFVFAYKLYAENLVGNYFTIKTKILGIFTKANVREAPDIEEKPLQPSGNNALK